MASVFMAALFALTAAGAAPADPAPMQQDLRCYRLMAELAGDDDPRISSAGVTGAQYFLGRIDARTPGFDPAAAPAAATSEAERARLVTRCGALMSAGGRDFRAIGEHLVRNAPTI